MRLSKIKYLEYAIIGQSLASGLVGKKVFLLSADGINSSFIINHNSKDENIIVQIRDVNDGLKEIFLENQPEPNDPRNKIRINFDYVPLLGQRYKIIIT